MFFMSRDTRNRYTTEYFDKTASKETLYLSIDLFPSVGARGQSVQTGNHVIEIVLFGHNRQQFSFSFASMKPTASL